METRAKEFGNEAKNIGREAKEVIREKTEEWTSKGKAMGTAAWDSAQAAYHTAQEKAVAGARATDMVIRSRPYEALAVAFGAGVLLGYLLNRK